MNLNDAQYLLLGTLRKNGRMVETPVWFAEQQGNYYMFSEGKAGKVKRLKNFSDASLAPCTVSGKPLGEKVVAEAFLLDEEESRVAYKALLAKYGWKMKALDCASRIARKINNRAFIVARLKD